MSKFLLIMGFSFALAACNSSDGDGGPRASNNGGGGDTFIAEVEQLSATAPEDAEPVDVEAIDTTAPEDAEPEDVG